MTELARLIRHGLAPFVTWLVMKGYLPDYMAADVIEFGVIALSIAVPVFVSWLRDRRRS